MTSPSNTRHECDTLFRWLCKLLYCNYQHPRFFGFFFTDMFHKATVEWKERQLKQESNEKKIEHKKGRD